jgi:myosin heavy subunit
VISGESGAGKTENAKLAIKMITSLSQESNNNAKIESLQRFEIEE